MVSSNLQNHIEQISLSLEGSTQVLFVALNVDFCGFKYQFFRPQPWIFPAAQQCWLGCWHRWLCDYSEELSGCRPPRAPGPVPRPPIGQNALPATKHHQATKQSNSQTETKIPSFSSHTVAACQLGGRTDELVKIMRPVALLTWLASWRKGAEES